jgi:hypothetical protein
MDLILLRNETKQTPSCCINQYCRKNVFSESRSHKVTVTSENSAGGKAIFLVQELLAVAGSIRKQPPINQKAEATLLVLQQRRAHIRNSNSYGRQRLQITTQAHGITKNKSYTHEKVAAPVCHKYHRSDSAETL